MTMYWKLLHSVQCNWLADNY